jgi:hypothetical protein
MLTSAVESSMIKLTGTRLRGLTMVRDGDNSAARIFVWKPVYSAAEDAMLFLRKSLRGKFLLVMAKEIS